jgi:hypothetical protein
MFIMKMKSYIVRVIFSYSNLLNLCKMINLISKYSIKVNTENVLKEEEFVQIFLVNFSMFNLRKFIIHT